MKSVTLIGLNLAIMAISSPAAAQCLSPTRIACSYRGCFDHRISGRQQPDAWGDGRPIFR
jgi:hypothetical protein